MGDFTPVQGWCGYRKELNDPKQIGNVYPGFFVQNHATYSCKTSTLQGSVVQFNHIVLWLALLIQKKHFKHLYNLCVNISVLSLSLIIQTPLFSSP